MGRQRPPVRGMAPPNRRISWLHFRPALGYSKRCFPASSIQLMPQQKKAPKKSLWAPPCCLSSSCQGKWLSKARPQGLCFGHGRRHRVPPRGWRGMATTDPAMGVRAVGCSPAAACSSRSSCCHPRWSGRKKRFRCKERQRMGTGRPFQPAALRDVTAWGGKPRPRPRSGARTW